MNRAYKTLILPDGTTVTNAVVVFSADGKPLSWHTLQHEEPFTEWLGGNFNFSL